MIFEFSRNFFRKYAKNVEACFIERILLTRRSFEMCGIRLLPSYLLKLTLSYRSYGIINHILNKRPFTFDYVSNEFLRL